LLPFPEAVCVFVSLVFHNFLMAGPHYVWGSVSSSSESKVPASEVSALTFRACSWWSLTQKF